MNRVVLHGVLSSEPKARTLPSGDQLTTYEVTTETDQGAASVPVAWHAPSRPPSVASGDPVVVVGHVRRRFFRAGGATVSRTEVVADVVVKPGSARARRAVEALLTAVGGDTSVGPADPPAA